MYLDGLDELDQKIIRLLIENARISYSDIGEETGISRVAVKARILSEIEGYKSAGIIAGGMIPKIGGMADAIYQGVHEAVIIDGRVPHSILLELFSNRGSGTRFYRRSHRE